MAENLLCDRCGHPMSAHEQVDHARGEPSFVEFCKRNRMPLFTTVCTQGRPAAHDASPWAHVCGCAWAHDEPWQLIPEEAA